MEQPVTPLLILFLLGLITGGGGMALWFNYMKKQEGRESRLETIGEENAPLSPHAERHRRPPWRFSWE